MADSKKENKAPGWAFVSIFILALVAYPVIDWLFIPDPPAKPQSQLVAVTHTAPLPKFSDIFGVSLQEPNPFPWCEGEDAEKNTVLQDNPEHHIILDGQPCWAGYVTIPPNWNGVTFQWENGDKIGIWPLGGKMKIARAEKANDLRYVGRTFRIAAIGKIHLRPEGISGKWLSKIFGTTVEGADQNEVRHVSAEPIPEPREGDVSAARIPKDEALYGVVESVNEERKEILVKTKGGTYSVIQVYENTPVFLEGERCYFESLRPGDPVKVSFLKDSGVVEEIEVGILDSANSDYRPRERSRLSEFFQGTRKPRGPKRSSLGEVLYRH